MRSFPVRRNAQPLNEAHSSTLLVRKEGCSCHLHKTLAGARLLDIEFSQLTSHVDSQSASQKRDASRQLDMCKSASFISSRNSAELLSWPSEFTLLQSLWASRAVLLCLCVLILDARTARKKDLTLNVEYPSARDFTSNVLTSLSPSSFSFLFLSLSERKLLSMGSTAHAHPSFLWRLFLMIRKLP